MRRELAGVFGKAAERLRDDKRLEILVYSLLILAAAVIFAASGSISCDSKASGTGSVNAASGTEETALEERLEAILSSIEGAGRVRVMIRLDGRSGSASYPRLSLFSDGYGNDSAAGSAGGVIVVSEGAHSAEVRTRLSIAVTALLGVGPERVGIFPMD